MKIFLDTETSGLTGPVKTVQFSIDGGPVEILKLPTGWVSDPEKRERVRVLLNLLWRPDTLIYIYNAAYDVEKLCSLYHQFLGLPDTSHERPVPPPLFKVIDLYLHAVEKSDLAPYLSSGGRPVAAVRRIPRAVMTEVREAVEDALKERIPAQLHHHLVCTESEVSGRDDLVTLSWTIKGRLALKALMRFWGFPTLDLAELWPLPNRNSGEELEIHPYAQEWHYKHDHELDEILADETNAFHVYAKLDILYLRACYERLGKPEVPTIHDTCALIVGYTRYAGFDLDCNELKRSIEYYRARVSRARGLLSGVDLNSPVQRLEFLKRHAPPGFPLMSSGRPVLETLMRLPDVPDTLKFAASAMLDFKMFEQRLHQAQLLDACKTRRMHPAFQVYGTSTWRLAGSGGFNAQGIARAEKVAAFGDPDWDRLAGTRIGIRNAIRVEGGGDFDALEMTIMASAYRDVQLQADLDNSVDPHIMACTLMVPNFPTRDYAEALRMYKSGDANVKRMRNDFGKKLNFSIGYGCTAQKVSEILGCPIEASERALRRYFERYKQFGEYRDRITEEYCTADTDRWAPDSVARMKTYSESMFGTRRYYQFDADIADILWRLGGSGINVRKIGTIIRNPEKGVQTYGQAVRSALLGAAIAIQQAVLRRAGNQPIQTTGAELTKELMGLLWETTKRPLMNVHDELLVANDPGSCTPLNWDAVDACVSRFLEHRRKLVKSLSIKIAPMRVWADK